MHSGNSLLLTWVVVKYCYEACTSLLRHLLGSLDFVLSNLPHLLLLPLLPLQTKITTKISCGSKENGAEENKLNKFVNTGLKLDKRS